MPNMCMLADLNKTVRFAATNAGEMQDAAKLYAIFAFLQSYCAKRMRAQSHLDTARAFVHMYPYALFGYICIYERQSASGTSAIM